MYSNPKYLISACLVGENTKYDGGNNYNENITNLYKDGGGVLICPEVMGGLPTPRIPCEVINNIVINKNGENKTPEFNEGAKLSLEIAKKFHIKKAILKSKSPSCGYGKIYDGTFSNTLVDGNGICADLLLKEGFKIYTEETKPVYDAIVLCAGDSHRAKINYNKVFHYSKEYNVAEKVLEPFICDYLCGQIILVVKAQELDLFKAFLDSPKIKYVIGGESREESCFNALKEVKNDIVLIHDGDRPYINSDFVDDIVERMQNGADNVVPYIDNLDDTRDYCFEGKSIQTPQAFIYKKLLKSFQNAKKPLNQYRDESSIYLDGNNINYIEGLKENKKLTYYEDLKEFENKR